MQTVQLRAALPRAGTRPSRTSQNAGLRRCMLQAASPHLRCNGGRAILRSQEPSRAQERRGLQRSSGHWTHQFNQAAALRLPAVQPLPPLCWPAWALLPSSPWRAFWPGEALP